jgi:hypothetical protein
MEQQTGRHVLGQAHWKELILINLSTFSSEDRQAVFKAYVLKI